ncbi:MAG: hypothetical protein ACKKL6_00040 [Candidatus Komeilibacteria bacterium]
MEQEQIESEILCSVCNQEPAWIDGLCQYCYEETIESGFQESSKEVMPKHGQGLKDNPEMHRERLVKKSVKIQRRR